MLAYYFAKAMSFILCILPAGFCEWLGVTLGKLTWCFVPRKRRRMARDNVMRCLGVDEAEADRIAKASWVRFGPMLMEVMRFPKILEHMDDYVEIEGMEYLQEGLSKGKGAVIATSHSGNWELMGGALANAGISLVGVAMRQKEAGFDKFINEYRRLVGMHITYKDNVREMFDMLKKGWTIGLLMDQDSSLRDGIIFDWFGQPTNFVQGPAVMGRFQGIPVFPGYITRKSDGHHKIIIYPPIFVDKTKDKAGDIRKAMIAISEVLEAHIRKYPEEWFWLHDRWKSVRNKDNP
jgi:KDO2-lipid IV(A) lauroyltransferase